MFKPKPGRLQLALLLFSLWIIVVSAVLFYLGQRHYGVFAPDQVWHNSDIDVSAFGLTASAGFQVLHVFADGCVCNLRAKAHIRQLDKQLQPEQAEQYFFSPDQIVSAGFTLPATPAVLIFSHGKLLYAGPYASGPLCAVDDSLIAPILQQQVILPGLWLNAETSACRCPL
ncbi:MAG: hypothetical protein KKE30_22675 [Gammaproteobacteria bacterium]|nr:hypothetical protein [Gammaproteobacteria bacterium]MBU1554382.1 hypothetical protein [Gammaproteobacteria bacterium]MBU2069195.1 hypothetical protein [Gammaproteobacteria bacterium]MBU2184148.1 hypothetical protein [Gammaproteobacteria bacterium]MBU2204938.1 hypothetical protein [Gammaproteobacteria bacterium]